MDSRRGDRVRVRFQDRQPKRAVVEHPGKKTLTVRLEDSSELIQVPVNTVTNYSLAARKAWASMPQRNVGRPKGSRVSDRVSVTIRVDRVLWEQFRSFEREGRIEDRTATINELLKEKLREIARRIA
jgi:uncharacterized protein (DUF4415 family)